MTKFEEIVRDVAEERERWEVIRRKSLLGRIRYNRKFRPLLRWARFLGRWIPKPSQSMPSWATYIATFEKREED